MVSYTLLSELGNLPGEHPVDGSLLILRRQVIDYTLAWSDERAGKLARLVDALCTPMQQANRTLDTLVLGYDGGFLVVATRDALRLVVVTDKAGPGIDLLAESMHALLTRHGAKLLAKNGFTRPLTPNIPLARKTTRIVTTAEQTPESRTVTSRPTFSLDTQANGRPAASTTEQPRPINHVARPAGPTPAQPAPRVVIALDMLQQHLVSQLGKVMGQKHAADMVAREAIAQNLNTDSPLDQDISLRFARKILDVVPNRSKRQALLHESQEFITHYTP